MTNKTQHTSFTAFEQETNVRIKAQADLTKQNHHFEIRTFN